MMEIKAAYKQMQRYAKVMMNNKGDLTAAEVCDFGDEYGFLFNAHNIYDNVYWCINKKTGKITVFSPYQNHKKFSNRKRIELAE